jgi:hypothetical protein
MSNYPAFFISTNKKAALGRIFVFHARKPRFLGEILTFKSISNFDLYKTNPGKDFNYKIGDKNYIVFTNTEVNGKVIAMFVIDFFDSPLDPNGELKVEGLMNRTADWMKAYFSE